MRNKSLFLIPCVFTMALGAGVMSACGGGSEYTKDGKLKLTLRNLYFSDYNGGDEYMKELEEKFKVSIKTSNYSWSQWDEQVTGSVEGDNLTDVFHANVDSYNFASTYKYWAEEGMIKALPDDLSQYPNLKEMIDNTTNIDALKINGHLYGIPIAKNTTDFSTTYSPFTYVYRRDWAKEWGVYKENDEYTWEEFTTLLETFKNNGKSSNRFALGDVEWGFPSITNFYKQVPHCFAQDETGKYVNNYTTDAYIEGLEMSKTFKNNGWYGYPQYSAQDGDLNKEFYGNRCGVLYENLSYSNYVTLRINLEKANALNKNFKVDEAVGIMKIKGPDGKYALEGTDNWFSMSFISHNVSKDKMNKLLEIFDWLLSEEGTRFSVYGIEGYDYYFDEETGELKLVEENWQEVDGRIPDKGNGAKYLRFMVSLGYDTYDYDPVTDKTALNILNTWDAEMKDALDKGELKVLKENAEVMWLTTPQKSKHSGELRTKALQNVSKYIYNKDITTIDSFKKSVTNSTWEAVLKEINSALGKTL